MANKRNSNSDLVSFAQDLYDVLGMNTDFCTQETFFDRYVEDDESFMVSDEGDKQYILFDNFKITITRI